MAVGFGKSVSKGITSPFFFQDARVPTLVTAGNKGNANFDLKPFGLAIYVGGAGSVVVVTAAGSEVTFAAVPAGTILPIAVSMILDSSTATNLLVLN